MLIRHLTTADLAATDRLRATVGFNQSVADWQRLLQWQPDGCFVAEMDGRVIATTTTTRYGPALSWIGMVLVHPDHRRQGIARRLVSHAVASCQPSGCIGLDATPAGKAVYDRLGFVDRSTLTRWQGVVGTARSGRRSAPPTPAGGATPSSVIRPVRVGDAATIVALDQKCVGVGRDRVLRSLLTSSPAAGWTARRGDTLVGFALYRPGASGFNVGPLVAPDLSTAVELLATTLDRLRARPVIIDVPDPSPLAPWLTDFGLTAQRPLVRMSRGELPPAHPHLCYAIAGPEIG